MKEDTKKQMILRDDEILQVFGWFGFKAHEVDITKDDIALLKKIQPLVSVDFTGMFERYYERFEKDGY